MRTAPTSLWGSLGWRIPTVHGAPGCREPSAPHSPASTRWSCTPRPRSAATARSAAYPCAIPFSVRPIPGRAKAMRSRSTSSIRKSTRERASRSSAGEGSLPSRRQRVQRSQSGCTVGSNAPSEASAIERALSSTFTRWGSGRSSMPDELRRPTWLSGRNTVMVASTWRMAASASSTPVAATWASPCTAATDPTFRTPAPHRAPARVRRAAALTRNRAVPGCGRARRQPLPRAILGGKSSGSRYLPAAHGRPSFELQEPRRAERVAVEDRDAVHALEAFGVVDAPVLGDCLVLAAVAARLAGPPAFRAPRDPVENAKPAREGEKRAERAKVAAERLLHQDAESDQCGGPGDVRPRAGEGERDGGLERLDLDGATRPGSRGARGGQDRRQAHVLEALKGPIGAGREPPPPHARR